MIVDIKPTLDLLAHAGVISGDSVANLHSIQCDYVEGGKGAVARFEVEVFSIGEED